MSSLVTLEIAEGVAALTLSRPEKRNALKRQTLVELNEAIQAIELRTDVRVLVLQSVGTVFCAGMDLEEMQQRASAADSHAEWKQDSEVYRRVLAGLYSLPVPTLAMVRGAAVAGGVGLVLACDLVIADPSAFFLLPEPMRGITAAMVTPLLVLRVGAGPATQLLLSGQRWTAQEALARGLCHQVLADEAFERGRADAIQAIQQGSPNALAITKAHLRAMSSVDVLRQLQESMVVSAEARRGDDAREGLAAFLEKRPPRWQPPQSGSGG